MATDLSLDLPSQTRTERLVSALSNRKRIYIDIPIIGNGAKAHEVINRRAILEKEAHPEADMPNVAKNATEEAAATKVQANQRGILGRRKASSVAEAKTQEEAKKVAAKEAEQAAAPAPEAGLFGWFSQRQ